MKKRKWLHLGLKKYLIWVFLGKNFKKLLSNFKSGPSILSNFKILRENKNTQIWDQKCLVWVFLTKNALFGHFCAGI